MIKLVVFDLDGTLVDSVSDLADSVNAVLEEYGFPTHETEKYYRFVGDGTMKLVERALPSDVSDKELAEKIHLDFAKRYSEHCLDKTAPYEGIATALERLKACGIKTAVASNKTDAFAKKIVSELFVGHSFCKVLGSREGVMKKPSPQILLEIIKNEGVTAEQTLYVGDSDVDVMTGHNAGVKVCGCAWGFRGEKELLNEGCDYLAYKPADLPEIIFGINNKLNIKERV